VRGSRARTAPALCRPAVPPKLLSRHVLEDGERAPRGEREAAWRAFMALELLAVAQELLAVPRVVRRSTGRNGPGVATVAAGLQALVGSCHGPEGSKAARRSARGVVHGFLVLVHGRGVSLSLLVPTLDLKVLQVCLLGRTTSRMALRDI
jgi:hypothetical protein